MNKVPHSLLIDVNAELELEEKVRRILRSTHGKFTQGMVRSMAAGLKLAHAAQFGRSNLTAWRIVQEWNDAYAIFQLERLLIGRTGNLIETPRLRAWERHKPEFQIQNQNPDPKIIPQTKNFSH